MPNFSTVQTGQNHTSDFYGWLNSSDSEIRKEFMGGRIRENQNPGGGWRQDLPLPQFVQPENVIIITATNPPSTCGY